MAQFDNVKVDSSGSYACFGGMVWPRIAGERVGDTLWAVRYGKPTQTQLYHICSMAEAYLALVCKTQADRNKICNTIRKVQHGSDENTAAPVPAVQER